jgi:predicted DsbA family dithiol-disulfide isomerase
LQHCVAAGTLVDMSKPIKIDFVSDVVCPWCALGLLSLRQAIQRMPDAQIELHCQPFELNPEMPAAGEDVMVLLQQRYGMTREQYAQSQATLQERGTALGFQFSSGARRIYNTFDAHRLLAWAAPSGKQMALNQTLLTAYFSHGVNINDRVELIKLAEQAGLDAGVAQTVLASNDFADQVCERETFYRDHGINGVPAIIFNDRHLIQGAQSPEVFEQAIRQFSA